MPPITGTTRRPLFWMTVPASWSHSGCPYTVRKLNLIERVWHYLKEKVVNNYFFGSVARLMEAVRRGPRELNSTGSKIPT